MATAEAVSPSRSGASGGRGRSLSGERAQRIIEAMRESVAEVGIAESTFERVAGKAEVSRGLLHYYFGTKERLLVEVIHRDTEYRIESLGDALMRAESVDAVIEAFFETFARTLSEQRGYVYMVSELFVAGRHSVELSRELGALYRRGRSELAEILRQKERDGILKLRFEAEAVVSYLTAAGDGGIIPILTDPSFDPGPARQTSEAVARFLLDARAG
jgi:AcrR family transcriptional regulator